MHIYSIHLRHFRRFSKLTVYPIANLNVIIGPNNSGKSSIFHALDLALNPAYHPYIEDLVGKFDFHNGDTTTPIEVWLFFLLGNSEPRDLHVQFGDKMSRWMLADKKSRNGKLQESSDQDGLPFIPAVKQPLDVEQVDNDNTDIIELLAVRFSAAWQKESGGFELSWKIVDEVGDEIPFTQADRRAIGFTRIPTHRDPAQLLGFSRRSLLGKNIEAAEIFGPLRDILEEIEKLKTSLKQTASMKKILEAVKTTITELQLIEGDKEEVEATITFLKAEIGRLRGALELAFGTIPKEEKVKADLDTNDKKRADDHQQDSRFTVPLSYQGDGIQNALLISTFSSKSATKAQSIEAIEEPEQSLEPWRVRSLLKKIASSSSSQLFISTHSPAAVGEIKGADNLLILVPSSTIEDQKTHKTRIKLIHGRDLPDPTKKEFERARDIYAKFLFARLILVVEGQSEIGYLPVALSFAAKKRNGPDLFSLGLELFKNFDNKKDNDVRAERLKSLGRQVAVLLDHDESKKGEETTQDRVKKSVAVGANTFVWSKDSILEGATGCDLEIMIAVGTLLPNLISAVKEIYSDPGHDINKDEWKMKYRNFLDTNCDLINAIPKDFPDPSVYQFDKIDDKIARMTLFALMHTPHSFKSSRDMRRLAELLDDTVPDAVLCLYDKLRDILENRSKDIKSGYWDLHKGKYFDTN